ncbi:MAG: NAD(P)H-binding protein [Streptosporangiales bacterium]|nr:NAD(P)H-binding protein [Streptosporangiales bacterium]
MSRHRRLDALRGPLRQGARSQLGVDGVVHAQRTGRVGERRSHLQRAAAHPGHHGRGRQLLLLRLADPVLRGAGAAQLHLPGVPRRYGGEPVLRARRHFRQGFRVLPGAEHVRGASRGTGSQLVRQALAAGHDVTAVARESSVLPFEGAAELTVVRAELDDPAAIIPAVEGRDVVFSALGPRGRGPSDICTRGTATIIRAMEATGVSRLTVVSASGAFIDEGDDLFTKFVAKPIIQRVFRESSFADTRRMEAEIEKTGLRTRPPTGRSSASATESGAQHRARPRIRPTHAPALDVRRGGGAGDRRHPLRRLGLPPDDSGLIEMGIRDDVAIAIGLTQPRTVRPAIDRPHLGGGPAPRAGRGQLPHHPLHHTGRVRGEPFGPATVRDPDGPRVHAAPVRLAHDAAAD